MTRDFRSDNILGCSPEVVDAITRAATGTMTPYGNDELTASVHRRCSAIFERDVTVFPVGTGTAANALSIAALTPPWGTVFVHDHSHVHREELGAAEFFSNGAKLISIDGDAGKLHASDVDSAIRDAAAGERMGVPSCLSLTQATEAGTVYSVDEMSAVCRVAHHHGAAVHVDGARFGNAVAGTGASPADLTWRAGVDILTFGATKNGALGAELIVVFKPEIASTLAARVHRSGHRFSKMRLLSAQLDAYLTDDLWLRNAGHANAMASRLAAGMKALPGFEIVQSVDANVLFVRIPRENATQLQNAGFLFYDWTLLGDDVYRFVTGFSTAEEDVDTLLVAMTG